MADNCEKLLAQVKKKKKKIHGEERRKNDNVTQFPQKQIPAENS